MSKVAKLITFSLTTRIIVDENATEDEMIAASYKGIQDKIDNRELGDNMTELEDDEEVPYDSTEEEKAQLDARNELIRKLTEFFRNRSVNPANYNNTISMLR